MMTAIPNLIDGAVPPVAQTVAGILLSVAVWRSRHRCRVVVGAILAGATTIVVVQASIGTPVIPVTFSLWAVALGLAVLLAGGAWRSAAWAPRTLGVVTIAAACLATAVVVNSHYAYFPTVGDALHRPFANRLALVEAVGARTGPPPITERPAAGSRRDHQGRLVRVHSPATASRFRHRDEWVYLPPAWFETPTPALPVIVRLPGSPGGTEVWIRAGGAVLVADRWAADHHGRSPILVFADPNGSFRADTECVDTSRARVDTYLSVDVPTYVRATFATAAGPSAWAVGGVSSGGTCAVTLALRHPDVYRTFIDFSGEVAPNRGAKRDTMRLLFDGSAANAARYDPTALLALHTYSTTHAWFMAGSHDRPARRAITHLAEASRAAGVDTVAVERPGGHTWRSWRRAFPEAFAWATTTIDPRGAAPSPVATSPLLTVPWPVVVSDVDGHGERRPPSASTNIQGAAARALRSRTTRRLR